VIRHLFDDRNGDEWNQVVYLNHIQTKVKPMVSPRGLTPKVYFEGKKSPKTIQNRFNKF